MLRAHHRLRRLRRQPLSVAVERRTDHLGAAAPNRRPRAALAHPRPPGRAGHRRPRAPDRSSPTTTAPASCSPAPPAATSTATASCAGPEGGRVHHQRRRATPPPVDLAAAGRGGRRRRRRPPRTAAGPLHRRAARAGRVVGTQGDGRASAPTATPTACCAPRQRRRRRARRLRPAAVSGGWNPVVHLLQPGGGGSATTSPRLFVPRRLPAGGRVRVRQRRLDLAGASPTARRPAAARPRPADPGRDPELPSVAGEPHSAGICRRPRRPPGRRLRRPAARRHRRRPRRGPPAPACARVEHVKRYTTIGTGTRPGQAPPASPASASSPTLLGRRRRRARHDHLPAAVHARLLRRRSPAATAGACSTRPGVTADARLARGARRRVRERRPVEAPLVLPARRRGHGRGRAARVPRPPARAWR